MDVSTCTPGPVSVGIYGTPARPYILAVTKDPHSYGQHPPTTVAFGTPTGGQGWPSIRGGSFTAQQATANAQLIAEAFNVATETGRSPRELADWQAKAIIVLSKVLQRLTDDTECECEHGHICYGCATICDVLDLMKAAGVDKEGEVARRTAIE